MPKKRSSQAKHNILAYGFDEAGFGRPPEQAGATWETSEAVISLVPYEDQRRLDGSEGVIVPQGIFEKFEFHETYSGRRRTVKCDRDRMLERERQVRNLVEEAGWVCFLVGRIIDELPTGDGYQTHSVDGTDLCKLMLNALQIRRESIPEGLSGCRAVYNEFIEYVRQHGIAKTIFAPRRTDRTMTIIRHGDHAVGIEVGQQFFFLPFISTRSDYPFLRELVSLVVKSISEYRLKMNEETPKWTDELQFSRETEMIERARQLEMELLEARSEIAAWKKHKRMLAASGERLKRDTIESLTEFFGLNVDPIDEGREDFKILASDSIACMGESKGTNGGVKREHINQVDSHRERAGLGHDTPGLLVINNHMNIASVSERVKTQIAKEQIVHAHAMNVTFTRTIDLLFFMRHLETAKDRGEELLSIVRQGGGWLMADPTEYRLLQG